MLMAHKIDNLHLFDCSILSVIDTVVCNHFCFSVDYSTYWKSKERNYRLEVMYLKMGGNIKPAKMLTRKQNI